jgi:hypothetical protein
MTPGTNTWMVKDLDSRAMRVTRNGQRELQGRFGLCE